ncbi:nardilysin-like [Citrus sinensis]|nr:nardilysin-like [Citrus sinensis]
MGGNGCVWSSDEIVIKSPNDKRLYRVIELENRLCALLVHDPEIYADDSSKTLENSTEEDEETFDDQDEDDEYEDEEEDDENDTEKEVKGKGIFSQTKKAAAAMCVGMGSFCDPVEAQGLAHFLEHMLFMGSTEFPDENEYDSYLSKHGGSSNAYTETEHTCYHFEIKREFLKGALMRFSQFFISPLMKVEAMEREVLAVDSEPLDTLQSWVVELFANVRKGPQIKPQFTVEGTIWKACKLFRLEAVKDVHILDLTWTLPCLHQEYLKKSEDYLAHLLGHEERNVDPGSHFSNVTVVTSDDLLCRGWATSISAGVGDEGMHRSSIAYIFVMSIHLTDSGLEKIFDIIGFVYQYIKLLRQVSPQKWIFKELQDIGNMEFRFAEEQPQDDYAAELAGNLLIYPSEHVIYGDYMYEVWDEDMIKHLLGFFMPENMRIDVVSKSFAKSQDFHYEPWFGSRYTEEDISPSLMELWRNPPEIDVSLQLPSQNGFIPTDFSIRANDISNDLVTVTSPTCIIDEPLIRFWYKLDNTFKLPRANTYFRINLKGGYDNVKNCILTELFIHLLKDELNEIIYQASVAKLETSVSIFSDKLELKVYGFNDKLPVLLSKILAIAKSFLPSDDRFKSFYDVDEKLSILHGLSLADLMAFIPELRSQLYIEGLCHGNLSQEEAIHISNIFKSIFSVQPLPIEMRHQECVICLPSGANLVRNVSVKNKCETNSVIELYFQIEQEKGMELTRLKALIDLFDEILEEPFFNQLRTKEQLGYVVECSPRVTYRVLGFCFCIQSSKYNPIYLQERIDNFISGLDELLEGLDDESFENYRSGLMAKLLEKDPSLTYESNRFWNQITDKRYMFDQSQKEAEDLKSIKKNDVISWYKTYLQQWSPKCRRLAHKQQRCHRLPPTVIVGIWHQPPPTVTVARWHHLFSFPDSAWHATLLDCSISSAAVTVSPEQCNVGQRGNQFIECSDNEVEEILVSTMNDKKRKEETRKKKKVSEAWEHFTKIMVNGEQKAKCMHCSAILKAKYQSRTSTLNRHVSGHYFGFMDKWFIYVPSPHTLDALSNELVQCLLDWNVDRTLSLVTLDNCTTNDAMVEKLLLRFDTDTLISSGGVLKDEIISNDDDEPQASRSMT